MTQQLGQTQVQAREIEDGLATFVVEHKGGLTRIEAGRIAFVIQHEDWIGNIHDHADQGVSIQVVATVNGKEEALLRFNCFDIERSYMYGPDNKKELLRMDPPIDGNPIGWTVKQLRTHLSAMVRRAGYEEVASEIEADLREEEGRAALGLKVDEVESCARLLTLTARATNTLDRGSAIFEAGNIKFGLEKRGKDLAVHVLADLPGPNGPGDTEETELLRIDCFRVGPHYHYGPRNQNHRIYLDTTLVSDPLEWMLHQFKNGKLRPMIERAGYPSVAAELDADSIAAVFPEFEAKAREMLKEARGG